MRPVSRSYKNNQVESWHPGTTRHIPAHLAADPHQSLAVQVMDYDLPAAELQVLAERWPARQGFQIVPMIQSDEDLSVILKLAASLLCGFRCYIAQQTLIIVGATRS
jgi:hypothetical protein